MSQTIQLPISVEYAPKRRRWEVCDARLAGYAQDFYPKPASSAFPTPRVDFPIPMDQGVAFHVKRRGFASPPRQQDPAYLLFNVSDPDPLRERCVSGGSLREDREAWEPFEIVATFDGLPAQPHRSDPWHLREEFLALKHNATVLAQFLTKWGDWEYNVLHEIRSPDRSSARGEDSTLSSLNYAIPGSVWQKQAFFRDVLTQDPRRWLAEHAKLPKPHRVDGPPFFGITDFHCMSAIETTITLDHLRDVKFRICARSDCAKTFQVQSAHGQTYCSYRCAHTVNVRNSREVKRNQAIKKEQGA